MSLADRLGQTDPDGDAKAVAEQLKAFKAKLEEEGIPPHAVQSMRWRSGEHRGFIKNAEGEIEYTDDLPNGRAEVVVRPQWEPEWPAVQPADPVTVRASRSKPHDDGCQRWLIYFDPQIGWWINDETGDYEPMHDPKAMAAALAVAKLVKPDVQVNVGDFLDLAAAGKFAQHPTFQLVMQRDVNTGHRFLAAQHAAAPWARKLVHEGNHDLRLAKMVQDNYKAALHLKRADDIGGWPVLSIPNILAFDRLDVEYVDGYPADRTWITDDLRVMHGEVAAKNTAAKVVAAEHVSTIQGHTHRREVKWKRVDDGRGVAKEVMAASAGSLCRVDGGVPSQLTGTSRKTGMPIKRVVDWQQGCAVVTVFPDQSWQYEDVPICDGRARFRGGVLEADPELVALLGEP